MPRSPIPESNGGEVIRFLRRMRWVIRLHIGVRGLCATVCVAMAATVFLALILLRSEPSPWAFRMCRLGLLACLGVAAAIAIAVPLCRLSILVAASIAERRFLRFQGRLITVAECVSRNTPDPFLPLLAQDTLLIADETKLRHVLARSRDLRMALMGTICGALMFYLVLGSNGAVATQAKALLTGRTSFDIELTSAARTILRGSSLSLSAHLSGYAAERADLYVRYSHTADWTRIATASGDGATFLFGVNRCWKSLITIGRNWGSIERWRKSWTRCTRNSARLDPGLIRIEA